MADHKNHAAATPHAEPDDGFLFVGHALALDLVNTEVVIRGRRGDLIANPSEVIRWWQAAQRHHVNLPLVAVVGDLAPDPAATHTTLIALRAALRRMFSQIADSQQPDAADLAVMNAALQPGVVVAQPDGDGRVQQAYRLAASPLHPLVFTVALAALQLLTSGDVQRLHRCENERCILLFYDTTKSATRRWCSLACMDRARSIRRYQQAKHGTQE